jgi:AcrR family transcriptional regulator
MPRTSDNLNQRRIQIANAACQVILEVGLENTRLKEIAARMGYTTGVIQHYFEDKEHLLLFAKNYLFDKKFARMRSAADRTHGVRRLLAMVLELLPVTPAGVQMFQLLMAFRGRAIGQPGLMALQRERDKVGWNVYTEEIRGLQKQGLIPHNLGAWRAAVALNAFVEGLAIYVTMGERSLNKRTLVALVEQYIKSMFGPLDPVRTASAPTSQERRGRSSINHRRRVTVPDAAPRTEHGIRAKRHTNR